MSDVKVLIGELDGQELLEPCEYELKFDDLPEVDITTTTPSSGDVLAFDGTKWIPSSTAGGSSGDIKQLGKTGTAGVGKFLDWQHNISSNRTKYTIPEDTELTRISADLGMSSTVTFTVLKNGSPLETLTITSSMTNKKVGLSHALVAGDFLEVKITSGSAFFPVLNLKV